MQNLITEENYMKYLTFHGATIDGAFNTIKKWGNYKNMPEYKNHETIRMWVEASALFLELNGVK